ncbi:kinase-like protein [Atractiella rhizophila]|nr:kinase-like protein [Atractiella rhizophila]
MIVSSSPNPPLQFSHAQGLYSNTVAASFQNNQTNAGLGGVGGTSGVGGNYASTAGGHYQQGHIGHSNSYSSTQQYAPPSVQQSTTHAPSSAYTSPNAYLPPAQSSPSYAPQTSSSSFQNAQSSTSYAPQQYNPSYSHNVYSTSQSYSPNPASQDRRGSDAPSLHTQTQKDDNRMSWVADGKPAGLAQGSWNAERSYSHDDIASPSTSAPEARKRKGFRKVRGPQDLRPQAPTSSSPSPLLSLTVRLPQLYASINPQFRYESRDNPRRVLTKPSKPAGNDNYDNEDSDYILYVNDVLGKEGQNQYLVLDILGQGTFGQVVKCSNLKTNEIVAVKVVKNKPAYFNQSMMEVTILELLNKTWDPDDTHHILRLRDSFIHHKHLCLTFELLSSNLYELIKQNSFRGLSTSLVRVFTAQLLDTMCVLNEARLIHCDLKPENILLKSLSSPTIKVIDFGSACHEKQTVYTYIQSRFYRSPEVILSLPYNGAIDMWSLGCICVELFLGLPLFPGTSEYNQINRIVSMLGLPPQWMLDNGKQTKQFFNITADEYGRSQYTLKSLEQYSKEHNVQEQPSKKYFSANTLPDIINTYPILRKMKSNDQEKEMNNRKSFIDFVQGLLHLDPHQRWTPQQARNHPFVLGEPLKKPYVPPPHLRSSSPSAAPVKQAQQAPPPAPQPQPSQDQVKRPYGGLQTTTPQRGQTRTYDAATYNQLLQQQQAYNQAAQYESRRDRNPYAMDAATAPPAVPQQQQPSQQQPAYPQQAYAQPQNPPVAHAYSSRHAGLPQQLAKLQQDLGNYAGTSITPVLRRDEGQMMAAWERRAGGSGGLTRRVSVNQRADPALDYLQEQAEMGNWMSRIQKQPSSGLPTHQPVYGAGSSYYQPHSSSATDLSQQIQPVPPTHATNNGLSITAPPQAYSTQRGYSQGAAYSSQQQAMPTTPTYATNPQQQPSKPPVAHQESFDAYNPHTDGIGSLLYQPIQPTNVYQQGPYGQQAGRMKQSGNPLMNQGFYSSSVSLNQPNQSSSTGNVTPSGSNANNPFAQPQPPR